MKTRPLLAIALLLTAPCFAVSRTPSVEQQRTRLKLLRDENQTIKPTLVESAYLDTYKMLDANSSCGEFFGIGARLVLDELVLQLRTKTILDTRVGVRMSGAFIIHFDAAESVEYRLFEHSDLNIQGPFFRSKVFPSERFVPNIGSFRANTRAARTLILLHELGHLIKRKDGAWLIPDDGENAGLSRLNTMTVESKCGEQIRALWSD